MAQGMRRAEFWLAWTAGAAALGASLIHMLGFNEYPLLSVEVAAVAAGLVLLTAIAALAYARVRAAPRAVMLGILIMLLIDMTTHHPLIALAGGVATGLVALRKAGEVLRYLRVIAVVVAGWSLAGLNPSRPLVTEGEGAEQGAAAADKPVIVHLILDEHGGGQDLARLSRYAPGLRDETIGAYRAMGFDVWPNAYSPYFHTVYSVPYMLNFGKKRQDKGSEEGIVAERLAYFDWMRAHGYRVHIWQSGFVDYCANNPYASCLSYASFSLKTLREAGLSDGERSAALAMNFAYQSSMLAKAGAGLQKLARRWLGVDPWPMVPDAREHRLASRLALNIWRKLNEELRQARPGDAYFAHMIFPHYPHLTDADCGARPVAKWRGRRVDDDLPDHALAYADQVRCATKMVEGAVAALRANPEIGNFVVILHGDHGSRMMEHDPKLRHEAKLTPDDYAAAFSAWFAAKVGTSDGRCHGEQVAVASLLDSAFANDLAAIDVPAEQRPTAWLEANGSRDPGKEVALPKWDKTDCPAG